MRTCSNIYGTFFYPDKWCMAFGENYVSMQLNNTLPNMSVCVSDTRYPESPIRISVFSRLSSFTVNISEVLRTSFFRWATNRMVYLNVSVESNGSSIMSFSLYAMYGSPQKELLGYINENKDKSATYKRRVRWFCKFPCEISVLRRTVKERIVLHASDFSHDIDGYSNGIIDIDLTSLETRGTDVFTIASVKDSGTISLFDNTFDRTFSELYPSGITEEVKVEKCYESEGAYIRWMDESGYKHYYLFSIGEVSVKRDNCSFVINSSTNPQCTRPIYISIRKSLKCSAENLDKDIFDYISSLSYSNHVQLYNNGTWIDAVADFTCKYNAKTLLNNVEAVIYYDYKTQNLW